MKALIPWCGSKWRMKNNIIPVINSIPHWRYSEPYGGSAVILLYKPKSEVEFYNDINGNLYNLFHVLNTPDLFDEFKKYFRYPVKSEAMFLYCRKRYKDETLSEVERAVCFFYVSCLAFGGRHLSPSFGYTVKESMSYRLRNKVVFLDEYYDRLKDVTVMNRDGLDCLNVLDKESTLFYVDPPYWTDDKKYDMYPDDFTKEDYENLIEKLLTVKGKVILSGYENSINIQLEKEGWEKRVFDAVCTVGSSNSLRRKECVWIKR